MKANKKHIEENTQLEIDSIRKRIYTNSIFSTQQQETLDEIRQDNTLTEAQREYLQKESESMIEVFFENICILIEGKRYINFNDLIGLFAMANFARQKEGFDTHPNIRKWLLWKFETNSRGKHNEIMVDRLFYFITKTIARQDFVSWLPTCYNDIRFIKESLEILADINGKEHLDLLISDFKLDYQININLCNEADRFQPANYDLFLFADTFNDNRKYRQSSSNSDNNIGCMAFDASDDLQTNFYVLYTALTVSEPFIIPKNMSFADFRRNIETANIKPLYVKGKKIYVRYLISRLAKHFPDEWLNSVALNLNMEKATEATKYSKEQIKDFDKIIDKALSKKNDKK